MEYYVAKQDKRAEKTDIKIEEEDYNKGEAIVIKTNLKKDYSDYTEYKYLKETHYIVSESLKKALEMYVIELKTIPIVIIDEKNTKKQKLFYIINPEEKDYLSENLKEEKNIEKIILKKELQKNEISKKEHIFIVKNEHQKHLILSLELVESILRRGITGINFEEIEWVK